MSTGLEAEIAQAEEELVKTKERLAGLRKKRAPVEVRDYELTDSAGRPAKLSALFGAKSDLILVHNMGKSCSYCTMWADGLNGLLAHIEDRAAFVVSSQDDYRVQEKLAGSRGWKFRMVSVQGTKFLADMGFDSEEHGSMPGVSIFQKREGGKIYRVGRAYFGPGDDFCPVWHLFDLLPGGSAGWEPKS